jgi:hypothetical protein
MVNFHINKSMRHPLKPLVLKKTNVSKPRDKTLCHMKKKLDL